MQHQPNVPIHMRREREETHTKKKVSGSTCILHINSQLLSLAWSHLVWCRKRHKNTYRRCRHDMIARWYYGETSDWWRSQSGSEANETVHRTWILQKFWKKVILTCFLVCCCSVVLLFDFCFFMRRNAKHQKHQMEEKKEDDWKTRSSVKNRKNGSVCRKNASHWGRGCARRRSAFVMMMETRWQILCPVVLL